MNERLEAESSIQPADREAFCQAAETALANSLQCLGPGSIHRTIAPPWRKFFHPPFDERSTGWDQGRRPNKLVDGDYQPRSVRLGE